MSRESFRSFKFETKPKCFFPLWTKSIIWNYFSASLALVRISTTYDEINVIWHHCIQLQQNTLKFPRKDVSILLGFSVRACGDTWTLVWVVDTAGSEIKFRKLISAGEGAHPNTTVTSFIKRLMRSYFQNNILEWYRINVYKFTWKSLIYNVLLVEHREFKWSILSPGELVPVKSKQVQISCCVRCPNYQRQWHNIYILFSINYINNFLVSYSCIHNVLIDRQVHRLKTQILTNSSFSQNLAIFVDNIIIKSFPQW